MPAAAQCGAALEIADRGEAPPLRQLRADQEPTAVEIDIEAAATGLMGGQDAVLDLPRVQSSLCHGGRRGDGARCRPPLPELAQIFDQPLPRLQRLAPGDQPGRRHAAKSPGDGFDVGQVGRIGLGEGSPYAGPGRIRIGIRRPDLEPSIRCLDVGRPEDRRAGKCHHQTATLRP